MGNETDDQHSAEVDPLHKLVESFLERRRRGENPSAEEYEALLPDRAGEIRDLLAALEMIERVGESHGPARGPEPAQAPGGGPLRRVGEYVLVREIGRGGMGIVYEAQQASLGRHVALKVLPFGSVLDAHLLERFRREAHAAACLHHPHIVPVFGAGEEGGVHYYAMQFIHGQPLSRVLREVKRWRTEAGRRVAASGGSGVASPTDDSAPLIALHLHTLRLSADPGSAGRADARDPERRSAQQGAADSAPPDPGPEPQDSASGSSTVATRSTRTASRSRYLQNVALLGAQVASALAYAHSQGIVHRDIKPSNLLLDSGGNIWVTDFGLAKAVGTEDLSGTGDLLGTLPYMAPERFRGWSDPRSDVYGLGITLYQVATLEPAFIDADRGRLIQKVLAEAPRPPRDIDPSIPRDLETIILKATRKEPSDRYQTADELAEDLRAFTEGRPIKARRASAVELSWRWFRRNQAVVGLTAVATVLLGLAGASYMVARLAGKSEMESQYWRHLSMARASTESGRAGQVFSGVESLRRAAEQLESLQIDEAERERRVRQIRDEAVACETLVDLRLVRTWKLPLDSGTTLPPVNAGTGESATETRAEAIPPRRKLLLDIDRVLERCAVTDERGNVEVCRLTDGGILAWLPGPGYPAQHAVFSPEERHLAVHYCTGGAARVRVWELDTDSLALEVRDCSEGAAFAFFPDGRKLAVGLSDGSIRVEPIGGTRPPETIVPAGGPPVNRIRCCPRGTCLAVSFYSGPVADVLLIDVTTRMVVRRLTHPATVRGLDWHPSGKAFVTACDDSNLYLWNLEGDAPPERLEGHESAVRAVAFSHDGKLLASRSWDTTLRLWDPTGSRLLLTTFAKLTFGPSFDIDDSRLAICVDSETVQILEVARGRGCGTLRGHSGPQKGPFHVDTSNDGRLLASVGTDGLRLWDMAVGLEVAHVPFAGDWPNMVIFHPRGDSLLLAAGTSIERWPLSREPTASGDVRRLGPPETLLTVDGGAGRFAIDGAGRLLAFCRDQRPVVIDVETRSEKPCSAGHPGLDTIALSTDGLWVATGTWGGIGVRIWDAATGTLVRELPTDGSASVVFSPDGRWLVVSEAKRYRFHEAPSWILLHAVERANPGDLLGPVAFTEDGCLAAVADAPDTILLLDPPSGKGLIRLVAPVPHILNGLCFGPSGRHLAAATSGRVIQSWDLHRIRELLATLGIDWELAAFPPQPRPAWTAPLRVEVFPAGRPGG